MTFDLHLWPSSSVKVTFIFIIRWNICCCVIVPSTKFVGSIEFEICTIFISENWNDVTMTSSPIQFFWNLNTNRPRVYQNDISNFILIGHKRAELESSEVNRELWRKKWVLHHCDLDLWHKVTNFNWVWDTAVSNHLAKTASKSVHPFGLNLFTSRAGQRHRQTGRHSYTQTNCSKNITRFRGGVKRMVSSLTSSNQLD